jgi:antitoxin CptB
MNNERAKLRWRCRRGMRELDRSLERFFDACFDTLSDTEKQRFAEFLELPDPDLYAYLLGKAEPADVELARLTRTIRQTMSDQA